MIDPEGQFRPPTTGNPADGYCGCPRHPDHSLCSPDTCMGDCPMIVDTRALTRRMFNTEVHKSFRITDTRAVHPTQVRAYALIAAANLPLPNSRPAADDLAVWRANVLRTAREFEKYIDGPHPAAPPTPKEDH